MRLVGCRPACRPTGDNRPYLEGIVWMARIGTQWRHLPDEYRKWNIVFRRYSRWIVTGVFGAILDTLAAFVERDASVDMIDRTVVRACHCAAGIKKGSGIGGTRSLARRLCDPAARALR
ncbi:transposase [Sphingomonas faeni]|uniref:transposase n=1 Tax=Sphingomonas faeni TaxID=185950 RepID=UPI003364B71A